MPALVLLLALLSDASLDSLNSRLESTRLEVTRLESEHAAVSDILLAVHEHLLAAREYYSTLEDREASLQEAIDRVDGRLAGEIETREELYAGVSSYLVYVYSHRRLAGAEALFCPGGLSRVLRRESYLGFLARRAAQEASELRASTDSLARFSDSLRTMRDEVAGLRLQMEDIEERIMYEEERQALLRLQLGSELGRARDSAQALEAERQRLSALVADLRGGSSTAPVAGVVDGSVVGAARGALPWPAQGETVRRFGLEIHPVYGTETTCDGMNVATLPSVPISAVAPGEVVYARDFLSMGRMVVLDHGDGYHTLYAYLGSVSVQIGDEVGTGDTLGTAGQLPGGTAGYYFGVRMGGQPVDPEEYLR